MFLRFLPPAYFLIGLTLVPLAPAAPPPPPAWSLVFSKDLATLGVSRDWTGLDCYQETMTRETFEKLLDEVYASAPGNAKPWIEVTDTHASIIKKASNPAEKYLLRFAKQDTPIPPRYWRTPESLPRPTEPERPLAGYRIALDPGHIGGAWARMEERFFQIGEDPPVQEGDMVLKVARLIRENLAAKGAEVILIRNAAQPVTRLRPTDLTAYTRAMLKEAGLAEPSPEVLEKSRARVFCVNAEIRARASMVNSQIKPDMVIALHFNGEPWGAADKPAFSEHNHLHVLVHGCLDPAELAHDDERYEMLLKLLQRTHPVELGLAVESAKSLTGATGLPAYTYRGKNARNLGGSPFVWARNLLASRIYQCPVVYLEPHVMNHALTYERIKAGAYTGQREIGGRLRPNIFTEYADATSKAVESWFLARRVAAP